MSDQARSSSGADARTAAFLRARPRLLRLAYATLGSQSEAEDVVQEAWLRAERVDWTQIREPEAWLTTVVGRLALDELGSARARRERYVGTWLPEPLVGEDPAGDDPVADEVVGAEQVSIALLVVMERMAPAERVAFVLHDVFGVPFAEIAAALDRSTEAVRALASRGRRRARDEGGRFTVDAAAQRELRTAFGAALASGELERVVALLDPDVVMRTDGGGLVTASPHPLHGSDRVARVMLALAHRRNRTIASFPITVNGAPGVLVVTDGERSVIALAVSEGRVTAIDVIRNPDKLRGVRPPSAERQSAAPRATQD